LLRAYKWTALDGRVKRAVLDKDQPRVYVWDLGPSAATPSPALIRGAHKTGS
jgi:hypothetical protein